MIHSGSWVPSCCVVQPQERTGQRRCPRARPSQDGKIGTQAVQNATLAGGISLATARHIQKKHEKTLFKGVCRVSV